MPIYRSIPSIRNTIRVRRSKVDSWGRREKSRSLSILPQIVSVLPGGPIPLSGVIITNSSSSWVSLTPYLVQCVQFIRVLREMVMDSGIRQEETKTTLAMVNIGEFSTVSKNSPSGLHWSCDKFQCPNKILQSLRWFDGALLLSLLEFPTIHQDYDQAGSGLTVGSTYIDIPVTVGT